MSTRIIVPVVLMCLFLTTSNVAAQPLGIFRWQQQPYCNVVTVNVVQSGAIYQLDGTDDQCGAATQAAVVGIASVNLDGTVGLGMTLVTTPGGIPLHIDATISAATGSGTWHDSSGMTGAFVLTPGAAMPGATRPVPRAAFPAGLSAGGTTITNVAAPEAETDAATKAYVDGADAAKANTADVSAALAAATDNVKSAMLSDKTWPMEFTSAGSKASTGRFTSSRTGVGLYSVSLSFAGLNVATNGASSLYNFVATARCPGHIATIGSRVGSVSGNLMVSASTTLAVTNAAGVLADCGVFVTATQADPDAGSPIQPLVPGDLRPGVTCTTEGAVTTCVEGPAPQ